MNAPRAAVLRLLSPVLDRAGSAYLVGPGLDAGVAVAHDLLARADGVTLAYWNRAGDPAAEVLAQGLAAVESLRGTGGRAAVAVKVPALRSDPAAVEQLAARAADADVGLAFDSHSPADAEATLTMAELAGRAGARTTVALPGQWARSLTDVDRVVRADLVVRLVKGQWPDEQAGPGRFGEAHLRDSYLAVLDRLIEAGARIRLATHDAALLDEGLARLARSGADHEAELLLGMPVHRARAVALRHRARVRWYLAFGHPSLAYPLTSVVGRPRIAATLAQGVLLGARNQQKQKQAALRH